MAVTNKQLVAPALLTLTVQIYYTVGAAVQAVIHKLTVTNTSSTIPGAVTIHIVPSGGSASAANMLTPAKLLAAGQPYEAYEVEGHLLNPGDTLQAFASVASLLSIRASGIEIG